MANIIVWPKTFEKYRNLVLGSRCVGIRGKLQNVDNVIHVVAHHVEDLTPMLSILHQSDRLIESLANADEVRRPVEDVRHILKARSRTRKLLREAPKLKHEYVHREPDRNIRQVLPKGRNFH